MVDQTAMPLAQTNIKVLRFEDFSVEPSNQRALGSSVGALASLSSLLLMHHFINPFHKQQASVSMRTLLLDQITGFDSPFPFHGLVSR